jgi:DNA-binding response OmpR family regulator
MKHILIVEDEKDIADLISYNLRKEGFAATAVHDGETALKEVAADEYDLVLLDLMLPGIQGLEVCSAIKKNPQRVHIPIIILTAKNEEIDKVLGLEMGADDYITKPFGIRELIARVKAVLRRTAYKGGALPKPDIRDAGIVNVGEISIDKERYLVTVEGRQIQLGIIEFKLLLHLAEKPGRMHNRNQLLDAVWGHNVYIESRTVDVHIRRLRMKIEQDPDNPKYIKTMRGVGYFLEA